MSASSMVAYGPARIREKSATSSPASGPWASVIRSYPFVSVVRYTDNVSSLEPRRSLSRSRAIPNLDIPNDDGRQWHQPVKALVQRTLVRVNLSGGFDGESRRGRGRTAGRLARR